MENSDLNPALASPSPDADGGILRITLDDVAAKDAEPAADALADDGVLRITDEDVHKLDVGTGTAGSFGGAGAGERAGSLWRPKQTPGESGGVRGFLQDVLWSGSIFAVSAVGGGVAGLVLGFLITYGAIGIPWGLKLGDGSLSGVFVVLFFGSFILIPISAIAGIVAGIVGLLLGLLLGAVSFLIVTLTHWLPNLYVRAALIVSVLTATGAIGIHWAWFRFLDADSEFGVWFTVLGGAMGLVVGLFSSSIVFREPD